MLRVLASDGHHGLLASFREWCDGRDVSNTTGVAFSHQLFDALTEVNATATVLAQQPDAGRASARGITVEQTGRVLFGRSSIDYHREVLAMAYSVMARARRERADVIMTVGYPPPGLMLPLLHAGYSVVVTHHCVLWPKFEEPSLTQRVMLPLDARAYQHPRCFVLAVSDDVVSQVEKVRNGKGQPITRFFPLFRRDLFSRIPPVDPTAPRLRAGFIGRLEPYKGIFDLLDAVGTLRDHGILVELDYCGDGSARAGLIERIERLGLQKQVICHGWCDQAQLAEIIGRTHVVVAPTRSDFVEGFNMVVVEALLAQRPVITSRVCPALEYVRGPGTVEVRVGDVADLARALQHFAIDRSSLLHAAMNSSDSAACFLEPKYSYKAAVVEVLQAISERRSPRPVAPSALELQGIKRKNSSEQVLRA